LRRFFVVLALAGCGAQPTGPALTFDACTPIAMSAIGATADQRASIDDALVMWRSAGVAATVRDASPDVAILFRDAAAAEYGFYDDTSATIYVNVGLTDRAQRAITVAHELGHAFALVHVPPDERASVMNPGNLVVAPTAGDTAALAALWGACPTSP